MRLVQNSAAWLVSVSKVNRGELLTWDGCPLSESDSRWRKIPLTAGRPTQSEALRLHDAMIEVK